jgi:hypothetical protein
MSERDSSIPAARSLVWVMVSVVLSFLIAIGAAQYLQRAISTRANDIVSNAMPSVKLLSAARGNLRKIEIAVQHGDAQLESHVAEARENIEEELVAYMALPFFPHERSLFAAVPSGIVKLDADYSAWRSSRKPETLTALRSDFADVDSARALDPFRRRTGRAARSRDRARTR